jgi:hypothetical protein
MRSQKCADPGKQDGRHGAAWYGYCMEIPGNNGLVDSNQCTSHGTDAVINQSTEEIALGPNYGTRNTTITNNLFAVRNR